VAKTPVQRQHVRLLEKTKALEVEHDALEAGPKDLEAHRAHRARLRQQIRKLRAHARRLRLQND
jgi:septal ring factor EnvC (AmiA/AmiB activator)